MLDALFYEVRYATRTLWSARVVSVATVLTLGVGIGLLTAIFSIVNAAVLRPLPYEESRRLIALDETHARRGAYAYSNVSAAAVAHIRERARSFVGIAAYQRAYMNVVIGTDAAQPLDGANVTTDLFALLGAKPIRGRTFARDEARAGTNVVVVAHELWTTRLGASERVIGSTIRIDGTPHTIVGVMAPGFNFPDREQFWRPLVRQPGAADWWERSLGTVARLRPGVEVAAAQAELAVIGGVFAREHPATQDGWSFVARPDAIERRMIPGPLPWMVLAAGTFLMLIACANVTTVLLARAASRRPEMALRAALGASRRRLVRQLLLETLLLAIAGGVAGVVFANWMLDLAWASLPTESFPSWIDLTIDWRVLGFTSSIVFVALFAIGVGPAFTATRVQLSDPLKAGGTGDTASRKELRSSRALVVTEVAAAFVLFVGSTLMLQGFRALQRVDFGVRGEQVLVARPWLSSTMYSTAQQRAQYFETAFDGVRRVPGVEAIAIRGMLDSLRGAPWTNDSIGARTRLVASGLPETDSPRRHGDIDRFVVTPLYFDVVQLPILRGRRLTDTDVAGSARVAVVSTALADRFWPNVDPLGRQFRFGASMEWITVVGVAGNVRTLRGGAAGTTTREQPALYLPLAQATPANQAIFVRAADPLALAPAVARSLHAVDPDQYVGRLRRLSDEMNAGQEFMLWLGVMFAAIATGALALASIGLYGVVAYSVTRRTREIGVRMALGADASALRRAVVSQALRLTSMGLVVGLLGAVALTRLAGAWIASGLGIAVASYALVVVVFLGFSLLASVLPARRSTKVDPLVALRAH